MLSASRARFLTYASGISRRFIDFAVDSFESCRDSDPPTNLLWQKHFADTGFEDRADEFHEVAAEILLSRTVDGFLYYLADATAWALWRRPEVADLLKDAKQLAQDSGVELGDAVKEVARLHAEKVAYGGFNATVKFIETTFGVTLLVKAEHRTQLRRIIGVRNMIAHNHSRKNARYCKDVGEPDSNIGQLVRPTLAEARAAYEELSAFVEFADSTIAAALDGFDRGD
jgi:hypothetical protein